MKTEQEIIAKIERLRKLRQNIVEHTHTSKDIQSNCYSLNVIPVEIKALEWVLENK